MEGIKSKLNIDEISSQLKIEINVFNNISFIHEKLKSDGNLANILSILENILGKEIKFAL